MNKAILATKVGMTQIFNEDGVLIPVTVLQAGPCVVTQVKTVENDGYAAVQVGFVDKKDKIINKDAKGNKEVIHCHGVPKALQGMSIALITAGLLAMAFMGFSGVDGGLKALWGLQ